jgi:hypothetical protein
VDLVGEWLEIGRIGVIASIDGPYMYGYVMAAEISHNGID